MVVNYTPVHNTEQEEYLSAVEVLRRVDQLRMERDGRTAQVVMDEFKQKGRLLFSCLCQTHVLIHPCDMLVY